MTINTNITLSTLPTAETIEKAGKIRVELAALETQLAQFVGIQEAVNAKRKEFADLLGYDLSEKPAGKRKAMSLEARQKIAAAQKARWAKVAEASAEAVKVGALADTTPATTPAEPATV